MVLSPPAARARNLRRLLDPLHELAEPSGGLRASLAGAFTVEGERYEIPRFDFTGEDAGQSPIRLGIFAGVHGDEPSGGHALVQLVTRLTQSPAQVRGYALTLYPVCNPTGYEDDTRHNRAGKDLNREFWRGSAQPEVRILEAELRANHFDGIIALHADDTCSGLYGYAHDRLLNEALLRPALAASERILPRDSRPMIDGFSANDGIIHECFCGVLAAPPEQHPQPFDIIFETPAHAPLEMQAEAATVALLTILDEYRGFIAQAQYL